MQRGPPDDAAGCAHEPRRAHSRSAAALRTGGAARSPRGFHGRQQDRARITGSHATVSIEIQAPSPVHAKIRYLATREISAESPKADYVSYAWKGLRRGSGRTPPVRGCETYRSSSPRPAASLAGTTPAPYAGSRQGGCCRSARPAHPWRLRPRPRRRGTTAAERRERLSKRRPKVGVSTSLTGPRPKSGRTRAPISAAITPRESRWPARAGDQAVQSTVRERLPNALANPVGHESSPIQRAAPLSPLRSSRSRPIAP